MPKISHTYGGTEGTSKSLNTFFTVVNITVDLTTVTVNSVLYNRQFDAYTVVNLTLVQPFMQTSIRCLWQAFNGHLCNPRFNVGTIVNSTLLVSF